MRNPRVRLVFLALILGLPLMIGLTARPELQAWGSGPAVRAAAAPASLVLAWQVEPILVAGLIYAGGQRRKLLAGLPVDDEA